MPMAMMDGNTEYAEMKRKLWETEQTLRNLKNLEKEVLSETSELVSSVNEQPTPSYGCDVVHDGTGSLRSIPESYSRFASHKIQSSTPGRNQQNYSPSDTYKNNESENSSLSSTSSKPNEVSNKYERKLLSQNQRLLMEVERLIGELHKLKLEGASLEQAAVLAKQIPDLEDKIEELVAETKAQDKALREAEKHLEESVKRSTELQRKLEQSEKNNIELTLELERVRFAKTEVEEQRDEALQNVIDAQDALEDYQKRIKEKIKKMENFEDELRDTLTRTTQERDDYMDQLTDIQSSVASQEAQINRLLNDVEKETTRRMEVEEEKLALQEQLKLLSCELDKLDEEMKEMKEIKKQKIFLESEMQEHRKLAQEIADLLIQVHHNHNKIALDDSGNFSLPTKYEVRMWQDEILSDAVLNTNNNGLEELNCNNNGLSCEGGGTTMMAELRNLFTNMDGEIQRLRYDLKQRDADDRTYQNLHDELKVLMDKVESGVRTNQELEFTVCALEDEKRTLNLKLDETLHSLAERERQIQCLDTRLNERNHQVVCLQEDNAMKAQRLCALEKDLDCCERRLKLASSGSNESLEQLKAAEERIKELEEILKCKENSLQDMQNQIVKLQKDMRCQQQKLEKKAECLTQQVYEYQKQTDQLSSDNDSMRQKLAVCNKASEECKRCLRAREDQIRCLDLQIEELKYTLEEKDKLHCKVLESYQQKICKSNEQIKNLECALMMCKNEVQMHLETMEKIKNHFECELSNRDGCIKHLQEELRKATEDLKCRTEENCNLEQTLSDANTKLANSYNQLKSCDQNVLCLTEKLKSTENQMLKDKACYMKETEELERRLAQALNSLQCTHDEIGKLKNFLQDKSTMVDCLQVEKNSLVRDLTKCKEVACCLQDKLGKMEKDNQELCRQLQQKMDCIRDMESIMCTKDQELKCCQRFIEELQDKLKCLQDEVVSTNSSSGASASLQDKIKSCREELLCQSKMLCECEEALKRCQMELRDKCEEIRMQNCTIEELNCKLHERIARVDELEKAIENLNKDIDKRMKRVDEQLKKYECELCDKAKQIADLDDCLTRCQHNLNEKANEACVLEQKNARLCSDWNACQLKLKECEETRECLGKALSEQRAENAELAQELRVNREHLQQKHQELVDAQQTLCACNRELERTRRECDDLRNCLSQRECEIQHLSEEKNCLVSKVAHLTCRLENETCQLQNQMAEMKCRLEKENESLRIYQGEIEENNACLLQKLSACQRQLSQVEKCCHQKLDCMNRELEDLNSKLADREDQIAQCKECLNLKENEIMRLKLRLCSTDRCGDNCSNNHCFSNSNIPVFTLSDLDNSKLDKMESPLLLNVSHLCSSSSTARSADDLSVQWSLNGNRDSSTNVIQAISKDDHVFEPDCQLSNDSSNARNSIGASEVQERLRSNQMRQIEIERQLKCLEEETVVESPPIFQTGAESRASPDLLTIV
ncbi:coiled-coil domain-containing protein 18 isoform X1 [Biomphalaria glabrata]|nr:coiled-coil domain-containing protein 18 isoform X1 [Biomphalaria glabrata]